LKMEEEASVSAGSVSIASAAGVGGSSHAGPRLGGRAKGCPGFMVLDPRSGPKTWKACCNRCNLVMRLHGDYSKVSVAEGPKCGSCGSSVLELEGRGRVLRGCTICDRDVNAITELAEGETTHTAVRAERREARRGRGRGGSRDRGGGRGRGRGRD